jgi:hypothetical protein
MTTGRAFFPGFRLLSASRFRLSTRRSKGHSHEKIIAATCLAGAIALPGLAQAREVTLTTQLKDYSGNGAYLAIYVTDGNGQYQKTLWVAGKKAKYYKHLGDWARGSGMNRASLTASAVPASAADARSKSALNWRTP